MATRRAVAGEKASYEIDQTGVNIGDGKSDINPAVPTHVPLTTKITSMDDIDEMNRSVIAKLLGFTSAMIIAPIGSYFVTVNTIFRGNATYAGGFAALVANVVLISYCVVAFQDDKSEREADEAERKKSR